MKIRNIKKILICSLALTCVICFSLFIACSKKAENKFDGFVDQTIEVVLGENYSLETSTIVNQKGEYFSVYATVKDSSGNEVETAGGRFIISDMAGYTVTYYVYSIQDPLATRTVTLTVKHTTEPTIFTGEYKKTMFAGEEIVFPQTTIYDLTGETITPEIKVYDAQGNEIVPVDGKVICPKGGRYVIKITATNSVGKQAVKELEVYARSVVEEGEYECFSDEGSLYDFEVTDKSLYTASWQEQAYGRQGVLKVDFKTMTEWADIWRIKPRQDPTVYAQKTSDDADAEYKYKYVVFSLFVDAPEHSVKAMRLLKYSVSSYTRYDIRYGMWHDYVFNASSLMSGLAQGNAADMTLMAVLREAGTVYIDRVGFVSEITALTPIAGFNNGSSKREFNLGQEIDFSTLIKADGDKKLQYTVLLDGKPIAITDGKFTPEFVSDNYTVKPSVVEGASYVGEDVEYAFGVKLSTGESASFNAYSEYVAKQQDYVAPTLIIKNSSNVDITENYDITTTVNYTSNDLRYIENTAFSIGNSGEYEFIVTATAKSGAIKFRKSAKIAVGPRGEDEVIYVNRLDATLLINTNLSKPKVIPNTAKEDNNPLDYQGTQVISFTGSVNINPRFSISPVYSAKYYKENFSTLKIPFYGFTNDSAIQTFKVTLFGQEIIVPVSKWTTLEVPIELMTEKMEQGRVYPLQSRADSCMTVGAGADGQSISGKTTTIYLGDITAGKPTFSPKLFTATQTTYKNIAIGKNTDAADSNVQIDKTALTAMNLAGDYKGETAVKLKFSVGTPYRLLSDSIALANRAKILEYEYLSMWVAVIKPTSHVLQEGAYTRINGNVTTNLLNNTNACGGMGSNLNADRYFNKWYKITLTTQEFVNYISDSAVDLLQLYAYKLGTYDDLNIMFGDIELYNADYSQIVGDNYIDENHFPR